MYFIRPASAKALVCCAGLLGAGLLAAALVGQYGFHLHPCELCIAQRVPYAAIVLLALASLRMPEVKMQTVALLCALLFLIDGGIAFYHSGVEFGIFPGPSGCTNNDKAGATLEEMRAAIMNAQLVPCDQPMAYILGLSMASWNAVAAFSCAVFTFAGLKAVRRKRHG